MKTALILFFTLLLLFSSAYATAPTEEIVEWNDVTLLQDSGLIVLRAKGRVAYYSLRDVYKVERLSSSGDALLYFQANSLILRIEFGKQNAQEKFERLVRYFSTLQGK